MKSKKFAEGLCQICGGDTGGGFVREAVIFGKRSGEICFGCFNVPKGAATWQPGQPMQFSSVEEMMEGGWDKKEAVLLIKAVRKYFRAGRP